MVTRTNVDWWKRVLALSLIMMVVVGAHASAQFLSMEPSISALRRTTLGYRNATAQMIVQTVPEVGANEKEIDFGDFDNDGDIDIVIGVARSAFTTRRNKLYRNDNNVYMEVSGSPIIPGFTNADVTRNAFFRDFDNDGWLDIIINNDSNVSPPGGNTKYYSNKHPGGVFSHFEEENSRLGTVGGASCGGVAVDLNHNGHFDLYKGNYPFNSQDTMYFNNGAGIFTSVTANNVPTDSDYTVDVAAGDINGDGKIDLLITNMNAPSYIYYNDLAGSDSSGPGDFKYTDSRTQFPSNSVEGAMEPADFNGDGKMDIYYSNRSGFNDWVLQNMGNDGTGKATFMNVPIPGSVSSSESRKATVADLNRDGRPDLIVMGEGRRPHILRNTSVNGMTSFIDWTPASEFPSGSTLAGWHTGAFNADGDGRLDLLVGGMTNDHLFLNEPPPEVKETALGGVLPNIHNGKPLTVLGNAQNGETDSYQANSIPSGSTVSIVLRSVADNVILRVKNSAGVVIATSDRGGNGIEEALQITAPGGTMTIEVTMNSTATVPRSYLLEVLSRS